MNRTATIWHTHSKYKSLSKLCYVTKSFNFNSDEFFEDIPVLLDSNMHSFRVIHLNITCFAIIKKMCDALSKREYSFFFAKLWPTFASFSVTQKIVCSIESHQKHNRFFSRCTIYSEKSLWKKSITFFNVLRSQINPRTYWILLHAVPVFVEITHHKQPLNSWKNAHEFEWEPSKKRATLAQEKSVALVRLKKMVSNRHSFTLRALCLCVFIFIFQLVARFE